MKNIFYSSLMLLCCINFNIQAQGIILTPVDSLWGDINIRDFQCSVDGDRYYLSQKSSDSTFYINNYEYRIPNIYLPHSILFKVSENGEPTQSFEPESFSFFLDGNFLINFYATEMDSILIGDSSFYNKAIDSMGWTGFIIKHDIDNGTAAVQNQWQVYSMALFFIEKIKKNNNR